MKLKRHCLVIKNLPGYHHPSLDLSTLGVKKEDKMSLAVTMPFRNAIACIDIGFRSKAGWPYPWEELIHLVTIMSMVRGMNEIIREDIKKNIDGNISTIYSTIEKTVPLAEAISDTIEEYSPKYRTKMKEYRKTVLNYFGTNDRSLFFRGVEMEKRIKTEKELLNEAAENLIKLYKGPKVEGIETPLLALTIYTASAYPRHRQFLEACTEINKPWNGFFSTEDIFDCFLDPFQEQTAHFPLDHFHVAILSAIDLVYDILEYYTTMREKITLSILSLPSIVTAIDFAMGLFVYFDFEMSLMVSNTGKRGIKADVRPRLRKNLHDFSLFKQMLKYFGEEDCMLCKSYNWVTNPDKSIDEIFATVGGTSIPSFLTFYYSNRYINLLDLMVAFEDMLINKKFRCPYCQDVAENLQRLNPILEQALLGRYITKNYSTIWTLFNQAAFNVSSMLLHELERITLQYTTILTV